jgi:hypothetical protein
MALASRIATSRLKLTAITLVCFALGLILLVQIDRCLLRYRAALLLDDFHSIRLRQSTWSDAQRLMSRWGAFGHYEGDCTATKCTYFITLSDVESQVLRPLGEYMAAHHPQSYSGNTLRHLFTELGSRYAHMRVGFLVRDGIIQRSSIVEILDVPASDPSCDMNCDGYDLVLKAVANDHLLPHQEDFWLLGEEEQLAQHPDFKVGTPSGCENCMSAEITFTPYIDQQELDRITAFNMSCFATLHVCRTLPEALPAAADWHLYPNVEGGLSVPYFEATKRPCDVPVFALARDVTSVFLVEAISAQTSLNHEDTDPPFDREHQRVTAEVIKVFKGSSAPAPGLQISLIPFAGIFGDPQYRFENLAEKKRYLIFRNEDVLREKTSILSTVALDHCSVVADSPQAESDVERGIALNDHAQFDKDAEYTPW